MRRCAIVFRCLMFQALRVKTRLRDADSLDAAFAAAESPDATLTVFY